MKVIDTFSFFNELELLKLRCEELKPLNPIHVLIESTYTHTGEPKELVFEQNKHLFAQYNIRHLVVDVSMPNNGDAWANEKYQRDFCTVGLADMNNDDIVIISDLDEIPRWQAVQFYEPRMGVASLQMDKYSVYLNLLEGIQNWGVGKIVTGKHLYERSASEIRNGGADFGIYFGGWHMSFMGGVERMKEKLFAYAHTETLKPELLDNLEYKYVSGQSLWHTDYWKFVKIDESFPRYLFENQEEFKHLIKQL